MRRLWECDNELPCPPDKTDPYESFADLQELVDAFDSALNVLVWWNWFVPDGYDDPDQDEFMVTLVMPRKMRIMGLTCPVTRDQEPEIREWLQSKLQRLTDWWCLDATLSP